jgi:hypothetical protein
MTTKDRDNFSPQTILTLRKRAGEHCSKPGCGCPTAGPNEDPGRAVSIGVAAHITAAAEGGPRYSQYMTSEMRSSIDNAIWLCQNCAHHIDVDVVGHPVPLLKEWKRRREEQASRNLGSRPLPANDAQEDREGWICPHCQAIAPYGASVCTSCFADIVYGSTRKERGEHAQLGMFAFGFLGMILMFVLPRWLDNQLGTTFPQGWGLGIVALLPIAAVAMIGGTTSVRYFDGRRRKEAPRFVRITGA